MVNKIVIIILSIAVLILLFFNRHDDSIIIQQEEQINQLLIDNNKVLNDTITYYQLKLDSLKSVKDSVIIEKEIIYKNIDNFKPSKTMSESTQLLKLNIQNEKNH